MSRDSALAMVTGQAPIPVSAPVPSLQAPLTPPDAPKGLESDPFAIRAKREAEFVKKQEQFKKDREVWLDDKRKSDEILKIGKEFDDLRKTDPVAALRKIGFTETEIFNFLAAQEKKEETPEEKAAKIAEERVDSKLSEFEKKQEEKEAKIQAEQDNRLIQGFKVNMNSVVEANKEKYEYCAYHGEAAIDLAYRTVIEIVKDSNGEDIPTAEEAMDMIEELYEEEDKKMSALKKRQPKVEESAPETKLAPTRERTVTTPAGSEPIKPPITKTRTLSNAGVATSASAAKRINETPSQKRERLMEALRRGKL